MEECGICFKDLENNLLITDDNHDNHDNSDDDSDDTDDDNITIKSKNNTFYNPISIELFECKTEKCEYRLCDECKDLYYIKYKNKNCPNCRNKIENIDEIIENMEEQKENRTEIFEDYYFPTYGVCRISFIYFKKCIIFTGVVSFIGFSSILIGSLMIKPDHKDDEFDDDFDDKQKLSQTDIYAIQFVFGFIVFCFIFNILRCCYKYCFQE